VSRLILVLAFAVVTLTGCSSLLPEAAREYKVIKEKILAREPEVSNDQRLADLGYEAISEGRLGEAETRLNSALAINPHNPYALLNLGVVYQSTGRFDEARRLYERVVALNPDARAISATRQNHVGLSLVEIARSNLDQVAKETATPPPPPPDAATVEHATLRRFAALEKLRAEGLLSDAEYADRRRANLGALLPLTTPAPSPLVALPAPPVDDIAARLREIARFRKAGALTDADYALERAAILDGLMPLRPGDADYAPITTLPADPVAALARLDRLRAKRYVTTREYEAERGALARRLAATNVGAPLAGDPPARRGGDGKPAKSAATDANPTSGGMASDALPAGDMADKGRAAPSGKVPVKRLARAEGAIQTDGVTMPAPKAAPKAATVARATPDAKAAPKAMPATPKPGGALGVHVASFRTPERARRGWDEIKTANGDLVGALGPHIARVDLGGDKGVFYQLRIGPLASRADAATLCGELKRRKLYCAPTTF